MDDSSGRRGLGEDSKPMRRSWLRSKRRQTLGQPGPPGYPPRVLLFGGKLTLGRLQSGGFEYRKREAGRAVVARPTEWVLFRGPEALPRFWTERFSPGWSGESSPSIGFWCGARQASAHGLRSLWGWALGDVVDIAHRQVGLAETHRHGAIEPNLDSHVGSTQARTNAVACDLPSLTIHLNRIAVADLSGLHIAQRSSQRVFLAQRPVRIVAAGWDHGHRVVPPHDELRFQVSVGLLQGLCSGYTQAFDQTVLRGLETAFHAALGLRRVRSDPHDVQFLEGSSDLRWRQRVALVPSQICGIPRGFRRRLKQTRLVGVIADRPTMPLHVAPHQTHVLFRRIVQHEPRVHAAGRIVDPADQVQFRPTILQPSVLAGVPLDQFAHSGAARSPWMNLLHPLPAGTPQLAFDHPRSHRLSPRVNVVFAGPVFRRQSRTETAIDVAL